ncbi:hydroxyacylglutathione hydrolase [Roseateles sp. BYS180W]|uniref:Hydroxyacylglutathione hydrolase n=1 Tax=Roseateles rivi TaxID=3299028 RepID=A0ABW7FVL2_9BURK
MNLVALPAFHDNYIWLLHDAEQALVVDPGEASVVQQALAQRQLQLSGILVTHHHADHVGGVAQLVAEHGATVWGPASLQLPGVDIQPCLGDEVLDWAGLTIEVLATPGHTLDHLAFVLRAQAALEEPLLFCGDTLFSAGCGRLFEGQPAQLHASLQRLASLPPHTRVCCAHEYTLANLRFARMLQPELAALQAHEAWAQAQRRHNLPTLPSTLAKEREINPYLRCDSPALAAAAQRFAPQLNPQDPIAVLAALRQWKNEFQ